MADVRDIMDDRLKAYERFLGVLSSVSESTEPIKVRNYQKGTITFIVSGYGGSNVNLIVEGTDNKGEGYWFNIDPCDENDRNDVCFRGNVSSSSLGEWWNGWNNRKTKYLY